jgi:hypothetical protein
MNRYKSRIDRRHVDEISYINYEIIHSIIQKSIQDILEISETICFHYFLPSNLSAQIQLQNFMSICGDIYPSLFYCLSVFYLVLPDV